MKQATLHQLQILGAIARYGSFTRAAAALELTQPTVSQQIKRLTQTIGMPLFEQLGKQIYLTAAGQEVLGASAMISEKFAELERLGFLKRKGGSPPIADPNCQAAQDTSGPTAVSIEARLSDIKPWSIVEIESVSLTNKRPEAPISPVDTSFELELQAYALEIARLSPR